MFYRVHDKSAWHLNPDRVKLRCMRKFMAHFLLDLEFLRSSAAFYLRGFPNLLIYLMFHKLLIYKENPNLLIYKENPKLLIYKENPKLLIYKEIVLERTADHCSQNLSESQK